MERLLTVLADLEHAPTLAVEVADARHLTSIEDEVGDLNDAVRGVEFFSTDGQHLHVQSHAPRPTHDA